MTSAPMGSVTSTSFRLCVRAPRMMSFEDEEVAVSDMKPPDRAPGGDPKPPMVPDGGEIGKRYRSSRPAPQGRGFFTREYPADRRARMRRQRARGSSA